MTVYVGTSGWSYKDWKGNFYPDRLPARDQLAHYASRLPAVEVDSSFYAAPTATTLQHWVEATPPPFRFALKVPRDITHDRLLQDCGEDLLSFLAHVKRLGPRLGPVILQLPPSFTRSRLPDLFRLVEALPPRSGLTVEFRHASCFAPETFECLRTHAVGLVTTDAHSGILLSGPDVVVRLLGDREQVTTFDRVVVEREADIAAWAERIEHLPDWVENAWVFVNNHFSGHSPTTALDLGRRLGLFGPPGSHPPPEPPGTQGSLFG